MRIAPPEGGTSLFDHEPELFATFNQLYGTLWSEGVLDQATKEAGRLRNARKVDCKICRNLRFAGAVEAGLTEDLVELIEDGYDPSCLDDELRAELAEQFTPDEIVELTATVTIASAFSKAAVAWGPPPSIPRTEVATPVPGRTSVGEHAAIR
jgi:alkylhydroperoxidase family enzyme